MKTKCFITLVPSKPVKLILMCLGKARTYTRVKPMKAASSLGKAPFVHANIRRGWKGLPETNTLAHYDHY
jgi:hypothetical protein